MYCNKCKEELPKNSKVCPFCGNKDLLNDEEYFKQFSKQENKDYYTNDKDKNSKSSSSKNGKKKSKTKTNNKTKTKTQTKYKDKNKYKKDKSNIEYKTVYKKKSNIIPIILLLIIIIILLAAIAGAGYIWYTKYRNIDDTNTPISSNIEENTNSIKNEVTNSNNLVDNNKTEESNNQDITGTYKGTITEGDEKRNVTYVIVKEQGKIKFGENKANAVEAKYIELTKTLNVEYDDYTYNLVFKISKEKITATGVITSLDISDLTQEIYLEK